MIVCLSRCVPGHAECTAMFISEYPSQACWTTWWESGITAICSSAACWVPSLWFCSYMFPTFAHKLSATLLCRQTHQNSWSCDSTETMMKCLACSVQWFPVFFDWMQSFIIIYTSQITSLLRIWWLSALPFLLDHNFTSEQLCITCQSFGSWHSFVFLQPAEQPPKNQPRSNSSSSFINSR